MSPSTGHFVSLALVSNIYKNKVVKLPHLKKSFTHKNCQNCYPLILKKSLLWLWKQRKKKKSRVPWFLFFIGWWLLFPALYLKHTHTFYWHVIDIKKILYIFNANNLVSLELTVQRWAQHHSLCQKIPINSKFPPISSLYVFLFLLLPPLLPHCYYYYYYYYVIIRAA